MEAFARWKDIPGILLHLTVHVTAFAQQLTGGFLFSC